MPFVVIENHEYPDQNKSWQMICDGKNHIVLEINRTQKRLGARLHEPHLELNCGKKMNVPVLSFGEAMVQILRETIQ